MLHESSKRLGGKVAVITGASSGVGSSLALALAGEGADSGVAGATVGTVAGGGEELQRVGIESSELSGRFAERDGHPGCRPANHPGFRRRGYTRSQRRSLRAVGCGNGFVARLRPAVPVQRPRAVCPDAVAAARAFAPARPDRVHQFNGGVGGLGRRVAVCGDEACAKAVADSLREEVNARGVRVLSVYLGRTATPMQARVHQLEGKEVSSRAAHSAGAGGRGGHWRPGPGPGGRGHGYPETRPMLKPGNPAAKSKAK